MKKTSFFLYLFLLIALSIFIINIPDASADGCGFTTYTDYDKHVYIPDQKAAIFWDGTYETMVISTKIKSDSDSLSNKAWVIPVQSSSEPVVTEGDTELFNDIAEAFPEHDYSSSSYYSDYYFEVCIIYLIIFIIVPILVIILFSKKKISDTLAIIFIVIWITGFFISGSIFYIYDSAMTGSMSDESHKSVNLIEFKKVDIYDVATYQASNASSLVERLNDDGFYVPDSAITVIQSYCDQDDFYFVVNKINLTNKYTTESEINDAISRLKKGVETPLKIKFKPDQPFYPMKMTSINEGKTKINVYFISYNYFTDQTGMLNLKRESYDYNGISRYFIDDPEPAFERMTWSAYNGQTSDLVSDSYFSD